MKRKSRKGKRAALLKNPLLVVAAAVLLLVFLVVLIVSLGNQSRRAASDALVAQGIAYLENQEAMDPSIVEQILRQRREEQLAREREAMLQKLYSGEIDAWSLFEDYVVLGDSRAVGFYYYDFLEKSRTLAGGGDTIRNVEPHLDEIKALDPSYIFLCYGLNDVSIGFWNTPEEYAAELIEVVSMLNREVPKATVIVSSILPAKDPAFNLSSKWRNIPQYSAAVESSCQEHGVIFVNNDKIAADHIDLYDPDGIHLQVPFYNYWGSNLIAAALEYAGQTAED